MAALPTTSFDDQEEPQLVPPISSGEMSARRILAVFESRGSGVGTVLVFPLNFWGWFGADDLSFRDGLSWAVDAGWVEVVRGNQIRLLSDGRRAFRLRSSRFR